MFLLSAVRVGTLPVLLKAACTAIAHSRCSDCMLSESMAHALVSEHPRGRAVAAESYLLLSPSISCGHPGASDMGDTAHFPLERRRRDRLPSPLLGCEGFESVDS